MACEQIVRVAPIRTAVLSFGTPNQKLKSALNQLPEREQDFLAERLLDTLNKDEAAWEASLTSTPEKLRSLRDEALRAHREGETRVLDPEKL